MSVVECLSCRGKKKIMGIGLMERNCEDCKGVGYKKEEMPVKTEGVVNINGDPVKVIKRGRKPKVVNES